MRESRPDSFDASFPLAASCCLSFSSDSRYPAYWPTAITFGASASEWILMVDSTFIFSFRRFSALYLFGSSIATIVSTCSRWFWIMSRMTPLWS